MKKFTTKKLTMKQLVRTQFKRIAWRRLRRYLLGLTMVALIATVTSLSTARLALVYAQQDSLPVRELQNFSDIFDEIKRNYVEPVEDRQLIEDSIRGMINGLDPHSVYLDPQAFKDSRAGIAGRFGGLGMEVTMGQGGLRVVAPIDDTPAHKAGIRTDDLIIKIDDVFTDELSLQQSVNLLRGAPGKAVRLGVQRAGSSKVLEFKLKRALIRVRSIKSRMLEGRYGYVRVTRFQADTVRSLYRALGELKRAAAGTLDGLVLDLRNNPGGVFGVAIDVAGAFLDGGTVVSTKGRGSESSGEYFAKPPDMINRTPLVVLVNRGSASASEIVAGALQDHQRATVVGQPTFGKGSVQTIIPIGDDAALKLTTAFYHTPSGRSIQARGIVPDVVVASTDSVGGEGLREADLTGHLEEETAPLEDRAAPPLPQAQTAPPAGPSDASRGELRDDMQLRVALRVLKKQAVRDVAKTNTASLPTPAPPLEKSGEQDVRGDEH